MSNLNNIEVIWPGDRCTFAAYMEQALYHPQAGYYHQARIGEGGDFFTSPHLGPDFGELLAEQFVRFWQQLGQPQPFTLVEMGAGRGLLALDILRHLHTHHLDLLANLDYVIIEKAAGLVQYQRQLLSDWPMVSWHSWEEMTPIVGCYFANELIDAFPVHLVTVHQGQLQEIYLNLVDGQIQEEVGLVSTPRLREYFAWLGIDIVSYPEGYRSEVNLAALDWLAMVAERLQRGYILTIDYGYSAERYYSRERHQGTLQCYYRHRHHNNPYLCPGQQDITAHVNFTALERHGQTLGLASHGLTKQALFLMELGLGDRLTNLGQGEETAAAAQILEIIRRRQALHQLIDPGGLGGFGVLLQSKNL